MPRASRFRRSPYCGPPRSSGGRALRDLHASCADPPAAARHTDHSARGCSGTRAAHPEAGRRERAGPGLGIPFRNHRRRVIPRDHCNPDAGFNAGLRLCDPCSSHTTGRGAAGRKSSSSSPAGRPDCRAGSAGRLELPRPGAGPERPSGRQLPGGTRRARRCGFRARRARPGILVLHGNAELIELLLVEGQALLQGVQVEGACAAFPMR